MPLPYIPLPPRPLQTWLIPPRPAGAPAASILVDATPAGRDAGRFKSG